MRVPLALAWTTERLRFQNDRSEPRAWGEYYFIIFLVSRIGVRAESLKLPVKVNRIGQVLGVLEDVRRIHGWYGGGDR